MAAVSGSLVDQSQESLVVVGFQLRELDPRPSPLYHVKGAAFRLNRREVPRGTESQLDLGAGREKQRLLEEQPAAAQR